MDSHHAIVHISDSLAQAGIPESFLTQSNDVTHILRERFSIDDARELSLNALQKPIELPERVFVVVTKLLPVEAQNALLKLFEEPPARTRFYLIIPQEGMLIPTLRSRVSLQTTTDHAVLKNEIFEAFLLASYAQRLETVLVLTKKKALADIENILQGAEHYAAKNSLTNGALLSTVAYIRSYSKTPGASMKMLLEELALTLPVL